MEEIKKDQKKGKRIFFHNDLPPLVKKSYTKYQDDAWRTYLKGEKGPKGFSDRLMRAQNNIDFSIELLTYLVNNNLLDDERKDRLRVLVG
jgi:hypothetical protein